MQNHHDEPPCAFDAGKSIRHAAANHLKSTKRTRRCPQYNYAIPYYNTVMDITVLGRALRHAATRRALATAGFREVATPSAPRSGCTRRRAPPPRAAARTVDLGVAPARSIPPMPPTARCSRAPTTSSRSTRELAADARAPVRRARGPVAAGEPPPGFVARSAAAQRVLARARSRGAHVDGGAAHRRDRHRQGSRGAPPPHAIGAPRRVRADQLRGDPERADRGRAVRLRARRVLRRGRRLRRPDLRGVRRHRVPRRGRRHAEDAAGQAAARARGSRRRAARRERSGARSTSASSPRPTAISASSSSAASSAPISISGSRSCASSCRRCAIAATICPSSSRT